MTPRFNMLLDVSAGPTFLTANATIKFDPNDPNSGSMPAANFVTVEVLPGATVTAPDIYLELPSDDVLAAFRHTIHITGSMKVEAEMTNKLRMQYETCTFDVSLPVYPYGMQDPAIPATINQATGNHTATSGSAAGGQPTATLSCKEANGTPDVKTVLKLNFRMQDSYALRVDATHELYEQAGDLEDDASWSVDVARGSSEAFPSLNLENPEYGDKDSGDLQNFRVTYCQGESC